jgi:DNA-binding XRE family transcriptional regulator
MTYPRRYPRGISKRKPPILPRPLRVLLRGTTSERHVSSLAINHKPAEVVQTESEADYVLVARDDFERMLDETDEREATAAYDRTRGEETVPVEIVDRLLAGESPIRVWREYRGMTLEQLGTAVGKRKGYLSEIESGKKTGTLKTLRAIAGALRVDLDDVA